MTTFLISLSALALITLIIWYLHKNHVAKTRELADSANPLLPLELETARQPQRQAITVLAELNQSAPKSQTWSDEIKSLRDAGKYLEALSLSKRQYPKMLAFRQSLITLRASLREESDYVEDALNDLYLTAILGDLVKSKNNNEQSISELREQLAKLGDPRLYWHTMGYKNLDLLTKSDCRLLSRHWGEPTSHSTADKLISI